MLIELEVKEGIHVPPKWLDLNFGGFQEVSVCEDCGLHISSSVINPYAPCENCGGKFSGLKSFVGIYNRKLKKWCKRNRIKKDNDEEN